MNLSDKVLIFTINFRIVLSPPLQTFVVAYARKDISSPRGWLLAFPSSVGSLWNQPFKRQDQDALII